ncbi:MAG: hypothetical protein A2Y63_01220 [Candidatus Riflebacteria bacterium RBG_13_59_9]|nr:MAG: hypothetical protein A2Y63_01220 [Candidatus Riflebacteria bacterium RBG_13_59_9]
MALERKSFRLVPSSDGQSELESTEFAVVDLETTGGHPDEERIIEIAAFVAKGGQVVRSFEQLVDPERSIPPFVVRLTGINQEMVAGQPTIAEVLPKFLSFIQDAVLVAHHADFDVAFLRAALLRALNRELSNDVLCTRRLGKRLLPWLPSHSLSTIADFFGIEIRHRHRAYGDAIATTTIMNIFLRYVTHHGYRKLEQLHQLEQGRLSLL